jgi:hypothetical protein
VCEGSLYEVVSKEASFSFFLLLLSILNAGMVISVTMLMSVDVQRKCTDRVSTKWEEGHAEGPLGPGRRSRSS